MSKKSEKIIIQFEGGFGNQLFQYTFYRWLMKSFPEREVLADLGIFDVARPHGAKFFFEVFPKAIVKRASAYDIFTYSGKIPVLYYGPFKNKVHGLRRVINDNLLKFSKAVYYSEYGDSKEDILYRIKNGSTYFRGFFQNVVFFEEMHEQLKDVFSFPIIVSDGLGEYLESNSVSIHVRRTDYVGTEFDALNMDYYKRAVQFIDAHVDNPRYYVFSDDTGYVEREFCWLENKTIVKGHEGEDSYKDMQLMSLCKHNIIANSTFSVWAAYLNTNIEKKVVYPDIDSIRLLVMNNWIGLNV